MTSGSAYQLEPPVPIRGPHDNDVDLDAFEPADAIHPRALDRRLAFDADAAEIATGGMKAVELNGRELVICNCAGSFYALDRGCGHMNSPLERGTLAGTTLTCPMHFAQFDVTTGEALSGPVPAYLGGENQPSGHGAQVKREVGGWLPRL